jgi:hypothetical protein
VTIVHDGTSDVNFLHHQLMIIQTNDFYNLEMMEMAQQMLIERKPEPEDEIVGLRRLMCANEHPHKVCVVRYGDGSIWVFCPYFGRVGLELGCKIRQAHCRYFKAI